MRTYYLFKINDTFLNLYNNKEIYLYKMFEQIYRSSKNNIDISYRLFKQMINTYDRAKINYLLENSYMYHRYYKKINNNHYYDDGNEKTKLMLYNTYIKIKANSNMPCFLNELLNENNIFVCDFKNKDYFWLNKVMRRACIK